MPLTHFRSNRLFLAALAVTTLVSSVALAGQPVPGKVGASGASRATRELRRLEREWSDAFNERDARTLNRLLAKDFVFVDQTGEVMNKAEYIDMVVNHIRVISGDIHGLDIRIHGSTGIAVARFTGTTTFDGHESTGSFRFIDVWAKKNGRWVAVSSQDTVIPD
jgi:ketosteroid isomerase-like protein